MIYNYVIEMYVYYIQFLYDIYILRKSIILNELIPIGSRPYDTSKQ